MKLIILSQCCIYLQWIYCQNVLQLLLTENENITHTDCSRLIFCMRYNNNMSEICNIAIWVVRKDVEALGRGLDCKTQASDRKNWGQVCIQGL